MMTEDNLECSNCGESLNNCDCGVDRDIRYRDRYLAQTSGSSRGWVALVCGLGVLVALRALFMG